MVIDIHIDHNSGFSPNFNDHTPVFRMRSMVIFMHIDYNNGCTRVFRMCLMVIDMCIDKTLLFLGQFALKTVISDQELLTRRFSPTGSCSSSSQGLQAESKAKRDRPPTL
jgi:hypothetical protein